MYVFFAPHQLIQQLDIELIGEEIYDEFDTEGALHGEVTSYVPPQSNSTDLNVAPSLKRKGSAPELSARSAQPRVVHSPVQPTHRSASGSGTPVLRPIAIPALKGLSFLTGRSRSMPPIPRDNKRAPSARPSVPESGNVKQKHNAPANDSIHTSEKPLGAVITPVVDAPATPAPVYLPHSGPVSPIPDGPINDAARLRPGIGVASHSSSPTPSLSEAILRARRPATPHIPGTTQPKVTRFKSSFTGVADHVLRLGEQQQQVQSQTPGDPNSEDKNVVMNKNGAAGDGAKTSGEV